MQEIRFSSPIKKEEENTHVDVAETVVDKKLGAKSFGSKIMKTFGAIFILVVLVFAFVFGRDLVSGFLSSEKNEWSAVFLSNGQVYFGKIDSNGGREMVLKQVYYLQAEEGQQVDDLNQSRFKLVKLGSELHGPQDILIINKSSVIFYEYLREDSKVVDSIKNFK